MNPKEYLRASNGDGEAVRAVVVEERQIGDMLINVDSVLNWPHKGIATSGTVDPVTGIFDPATVAVFYYTLSGSMIHIDEFAAGYTDEGHLQNQLILLKPTTPWANAVAEAAEQPSLPAGGTTGQILTKASDTDGDADWQDASSGVSVGDIFMSLRSTPEVGRLFMNGGTYNKADYPVLWSLNTTHPAYFASSTTDTFTLADMSSRVPVGKAAAGTFGVLGALMGAETHTLTTAEMPAHSHSASSNSTGSHAHDAPSGFGFQLYKTGAGRNTVGSGGSLRAISSTNSDHLGFAGGTASDGVHSHTITVNNNGGGDAHNNIQPSIVLNFEVVAQ